MDTDTTETTPQPDRPASGPAEEGIGSSDHLVRLRNGRMLAGVAAGLADWFDVDPTLVRVAFLALALLGGVAVPIYLAAWLLIPEEGSDVSVAEELLARERVR
jgi:phage shock protein PspC (stress-responsive transcriptional regulator)